MGSDPAETVLLDVLPTRSGPRRLLRATEWMLGHEDHIDERIWQQIYSIMETAPSRRTRLMAARLLANRLDPEPRAPVLVLAPTQVNVTWQSPAATPSTSPSRTLPASYSISYTSASDAGPASSPTDASAKA
jgi:hypothetical protein